VLINYGEIKPQPQSKILYLICFERTCWFEFVYYSSNTVIYSSYHSFPIQDW